MNVYIIDILLVCVFPVTLGSYGCLEEVMSHPLG